MHPQFRNGPGLVPARLALPRQCRAAPRPCSSAHRCTASLSLTGPFWTHCRAQDRRVEFIRESLVELDGNLRQPGGQAGCRPDRVPWAGQRRNAVQLARRLGRSGRLCQRTTTNPRRWHAMKAVRQATGSNLACAFHTCKDHVIFERRELLTQAGTPYGVFTPYKNAWRTAARRSTLRSIPVAPWAQRWLHAHSIAASQCPALSCWVSSPPTCASSENSHRRIRCAQRCSMTSWNAWTSTTPRATFRPSRARATSVCTCALAPCPSGSWCHLHCSARRQAAPGRPSGSAN